ncbi:hypothetical protein [Bacillus sp. DE0042]|nr:hypothetical protein [Bacillus sp. DE0042]
MKSDAIIIDFTALRIQNVANIVGVAMDFFHIDEEENCNYIPRIRSPAFI